MASITNALIDFSLNTHKLPLYKKKEKKKNDFHSPKSQSFPQSSSNMVNLFPEICFLVPTSVFVTFLYVKLNTTIKGIYKRMNLTGLWFLKFEIYDVRDYQTGRRDNRYLTQQLRAHSLNIRQETGWAMDMAQDF